MHYPMCDPNGAFNAPQSRVNYVDRQRISTALTSLQFVPPLLLHSAIPMSIASCRLCLP
jgi:hypothetical protein